MCFQGFSIQLYLFLMMKKASEFNLRHLTKLDWDNDFCDYSCLLFCRAGCNMQQICTNIKLLIIICSCSSYKYLNKCVSYWKTSSFCSIISVQPQRKNWVWYHNLWFVFNFPWVERWQRSYSQRCCWLWTLPSRY